MRFVRLAVESVLMSRTAPHLKTSGDVAGHLPCGD